MLVQDLEVNKVKMIGDKCYQFKTEIIYGLEVIMLRVWNADKDKIEESAHNSGLQATNRLLHLLSKPVIDESDIPTINYTQLNN